MRFASLCLIFVGLMTSAFVANGQMSSVNYEIEWDSIGVGGVDDSVSSNYQIRDTSGNSGIGTSSSTSYQLASGYRQGVFDQIITFSVFAQNNASERIATELSGTTITASTSGISVGDYIVLIQNKGASQVSALGQVISLGSGTITVDELKDGGVAPVIDGVNDYLYRLLGSSASLGELSASSVATSIIGFEVTADLIGGYVVQVYEDGNLRDGVNDINDVADGAVTAGSEEYGARGSDASVAFGLQDLAFTSALQDAAARSAVAFKSRDFLTLKASMSPSTPNGNYSHALTFIVSGNF